MSYFKEKYLNTIEYRCKYSKTKELIRKWLQPGKHGHCCWEAIVSTEGRAAERDMLACGVPWMPKLSAPFWFTGPSSVLGMCLILGLPVHAIHNRMACFAIQNLRLFFYSIHSCHYSVSWMLERSWKLWHYLTGACGWTGVPVLGPAGWRTCAPGSFANIVSPSNLCCDDTSTPPGAISLNPK